MTIDFALICMYSSLPVETMAPVTGPLPSRTKRSLFVLQRISPPISAIVSYSAGTSTALPYTSPTPEPW